MLIRITDKAAQDLKPGQKVWLVMFKRVYEGTFAGIVRDPIISRSDFLTFMIRGYNGPELEEYHSTWLFTTKEEADGMIENELDTRIAVQKKLISDVNREINGKLFMIKIYKSELRELRKLRNQLKEKRRA